MNTRISHLILGLAVLGGLSACTHQLLEEPQARNAHRVHFAAGTAQTKTGITVEDGLMTPDWRKTDPANVHLFEIGAEGYSVGEDVAISLSEENKVAHFQADFPTDMTIIVDPSKKNSTLLASNESNVGPYYYAAIVAQATESAYIVPAIQHPDAETLIDPSADFLIGYSRKSYDAHNWEEDVVDLYFDRPVALGRINISSFEEGEKVKSVVIKAPGLSGSTVYKKVDFENATVTFTPSDAEALTLDYGAGAALAENSTFGAYFVALPGTAQVSEIVVSTDKWVYTKTVGREITFSKDSFKNLTLDLSDEGVTKEAAAPTEIKWYKASMFEDGIDYLIVSAGQALKNNDGATAGVSVTDNEGVITLEAADPTIVWTAAAHTEMTGSGSSDVVAGHFTITNEGYYLQRNSEEILLATTIPSDKPKYVVWDYDGTYLRHESSSTMTFYCYYDSKWTSSYTQNGAAPGSSIKTAQIYTCRAPQELAFTPAASAEYDLATSEWTVAVPTLSGAQTSVSYALSEDSNPAVATVDTDGTVHPLSRGTVTIIATATGNDQYQAATAIYTMRVVDSSVTTNTYYKVTSTSDLTVGDQYLLVYEGGSKVFNPILDGSVFSKATANALDAEISSNTIISDSFVDSHLTLESGYYLKVEKYSNYLYPNVASSRGVLSAESAASHALNVSIGSNGVASIIAQSGTYYLVWSTSSNYFSSNTDIEGEYSTGICLYKLDDGRLPQTPSFSPAEVNYDMAGSAALVKPDLSNAIGTVTYSSSNAAVASVDASTGDVTVHGRGTVEIIATAAGNSQYKPGSASYTLVITNSSITIPTWYKADEIVAGETYMIISNGNALKLDGTSIATVADASFSGASFQYEEDENLIWTAAASSGKFTFKSGSSFISRSSSNISTSSSSGATFSYDGAQNYLTVAGNSGTYYLYYSESQGSWMFSTSSGNTHTAAVYTMSPQLLPRNLAFSSVSVTHDLATQGTNVEEPTLSGVTDGVEYSSSNTSVATVNATTGEVTLAGITGSVVITASASKTDTYKAETVSYTIRVTDSSAPVTTATYTKVTSSTDLVVGGKYLLVYESGSKVFKPTLNGSNFATTGNALDVSITDETIVSDEYEDCQMTLEDGYYFYVASVSRYLYPTYNNMGAEETKSSSHSFNISISNGTATITRTSNSTTYNLRYSSSSSYFQASSSSANVALYKLENP